MPLCPLGTLPRPWGRVCQVWAEEVMDLAPARRRQVLSWPQCELWLQGPPCEGLQGPHSFPRPLDLHRQQRDLQ